MAMAVLRINFVRKDGNEKRAAKANIKYIQCRRGRENERMVRTLFSVGGELTRAQAYRMIDEAEVGSTFFRIKICPDPEKEDKNHDLLLREITAKTMALEEQLGKP